MAASSRADAGLRRSPRERTRRRLLRAEASPPAILSHRGSEAGEHEERRMTTKNDLTAQEWDTVLEGRPSAGMIVVMAGRGGTIRETFAIGKASAETRRQHGASELLDEV